MARQQIANLDYVGSNPTLNSNKFFGFILNRGFTSYTKYPILILYEIGNGTMKRKPKVPKVPKERNPFVAHLATKRSGAHGKSKKAERRAAKVSLQQMDRCPSGQRELTFNQSH